ncbi:MAG: oxidoreductase [Acidimicrobiales bacterium]
MTDFPTLLSPGSIGPMRLRNRIVMAPMGDRLANDDGTISDRQAAYLEARARGGAGLLLIGSVAVSYPRGAYAPCQTAISDDRFVPGLSALAERVHAHGACLGAQLVHDGANSLYDIAEGRPMLVPSKPPRLRPDALSAMITPSEMAAMIRPFTTPTTATDYRVADGDDIAWLIDQFVAAARRARAAGLDGVEIHGGHGYIIDSFLSPALNRRTDEWGGSLANRARLLCEVIAAVRSAVGDDLAVWCRINAVERYIDQGETPDDLVEVAALAEKAGADAIHVSAGTDAGAALGVTEAHTPHEPGLLLPFARLVSRRVGVPVISVGRIEPEVAETALAAGDADFIAMGRKLLAEPDLPNLLAAGRVDDVRPCIYQYRCIGNIFLNEPVRCVANPATADGDEPALPAADSPRRVLVVGGGPAGLEVARLLAQRGHRVVLAEAGPRLGGALNLAGPTDEPLDRFRRWQIGQVEKAAVELMLGTPVTAAIAAGLEVDEIVVATGGRWSAPDDAAGQLFDGAAPGATVGARTNTSVAELGDWLEGQWSPDADDVVSHDVVVLGGGKIAMSFAGLCARRGRSVTVLEPGAVLAPEIGPPGRFRLVHDTEQLGVRLVTRASATDLTELLAAARPITLVSAVCEPDRSMADELTELLAPLRRPVHVIGDAAGTGRLESALADARRVAMLV